MSKSTGNCWHERKPHPYPIRVADLSEVLGGGIRARVKANVFFFDRKPASETPWTRALWIYDLCTNKHFTLKTNPLARADLDGFVACYNRANRHDRKPSERFRPFAYEDLVERDKVSLDITWLRDESVDSDSLPPPDVLTQEIIEDLRAALGQFEELSADLPRYPRMREANGSCLMENPVGMSSGARWKIHY